MISIFLQGGLGNQMFQIFALISYCLDNDVLFFIPKRKMDPRSAGGAPRPTYWDSIFKALEPYLNDDKHLEKRYQEPHFHFKPVPKLDDKNFEFQMYGYFQSPYYYHHNFSKINDILRLTNKKAEIKKKYEIMYFDKPTISIHFRHGDFKNLEDFHPILKISYYKNALRKIMETTGKNDFRVLYFCEANDNKKINDYIRFIKKYKEFKKLKFVKADQEAPDYEQMLLMSNCDHNIIANSTFSWWSGYLNENHEKCVVYPDVWFGEKLKGYETKDLFPFSNWIKISE
tara:strand:+ start:1118 stop:1975 length:858 start_codon:yes stop_codon:yes gene_type:complete